VGQCDQAGAVVAIAYDYEPDRDIRELGHGAQGRIDVFSKVSSVQARYGEQLELIVSALNSILKEIVVDARIDDMNDVSGDAVGRD
jgi:hypothetical protein